MTEFQSNNVNLERMSRRERLRVARVRSVLAGLATPYVAEYRPSPTLIEDTQVGYDSEGNYHCPSLRTEHLSSEIVL